MPHPRHRQYQSRDHPAEQRRAEAALKRQAQLIQLSPTATIVRNIEGIISFWSDGAQTLYGWTSQEALGRSTHELLRTEFPQPFQEIVAELRRRGKWTGELRHQTKDGQTRIVESHWLGQFDSQGNVVELMESNVDITERKRAEEELRCTERRLRVLSESDMVGTMFWNVDGRITGANDRFLRMLGYSRSDLTGGRLRWAELTPREYWLLDEQAIGQLKATGVDIPYEKEFFRRDGTRVPVIVGAAMLDEKQQEGVAFVLDITERKLAELRLARDLEAVTELQEVGSLFVREGTLQGVMEKIVEAAIAISRADFGNIQLLEPDAGLRIAAQRGFPEWYLEFWNEVSAGVGSCGTALAKGERVIISDVERSQIFRGTPALEMQRRAGVRAVQSTPVRSRSGKFLGMISTHFKAPQQPDEHALKLLDLLARQAGDIIERAQVEAALWAAKEDLARANEELESKVRERTAKLGETVAELEGFSYSLVHDMRAPLRAMLSYAGILATEAGPRLLAEESDLLRRISLAAKRMDQLVTDSLNYSKILLGDLPIGTVNLGPLLRGMVETYPNLHPPQADLAIEFDDLLVHGNEAALTQIFSNLLGNAVKFVAPGVRPHVLIRAEIRRCPDTFSQPEADCALIWVEDNGIGIPRAAHERIFGMFQRLHHDDQYPGTGIGLALVKKSLARLGGQITVESEPGQGSRFCVQLLLAEASSERSQPDVVFT